MAIKYTTVKDSFPNMTKSLTTLNNKKVEVGCIKGDHTWLAGIHEYGCDIKAKRAKYLTIPIHPDAVGKKARSFSDLFFFEAKSGEKFLARGEGDDLIFYYWLTPSVKIPERSFLRAGHDEHIDEVMKKADMLIGQVINGKMSEEQLLNEIGLSLSTKIKTYARNLSSPPNSNATILQKGSSNPLVDTGNMIEGISFRVK